MSSLPAACILALACILPAEDLTGTVEVLGNPVRQWYGPGFPLAGAGGAVAFQGRIYIGWGDTNNRWWKPVLAYRTADDRFVNDMPFNRLAHSCISGGAGSAFTICDNELFIQDYDNQAGGQQFSRMRGGWHVTNVGTGTGSDGGTKGHDTDLVRFRGQLLRERGLYLAGGANLSVNADGSSWRIAGRGAGYPRNGAAQNWLFSERLLPIDGSLAMIGSLFTAGTFPAEAPVAALATLTGDADEPARAALFEQHQLLGGFRAGAWIPFRGGAVGCNADGGARVDRLIGADTGLRNFAWDAPREGVTIRYTYLPQLAEIDGRLAALSAYDTDADGNGTVDGLRLVLRQSDDGLNWSETWRCDFGPGDRPYGIAYADGAWYTGYGDPRSSGGSGRNGNLLRLRSGTTNRPPTVALGGISVGNAVAPGSARLTATASDPDGSIARVEFFAGTTFLGSVNTAPYAWDWTSVPAGTWTITARAIDDAGAITSSVINGLGATGYGSVTIAADVPAGYPTVRLLDQTVEAAYTVQGPRTLVLYAHAADAGGSIARVEFWADGMKLGEDAMVSVCGTENLYSWSWSAPAGTHAITARAVDSSGNATISESVTAIVEADPDLPVVSLGTLPTTAVPGQAISLTATATDADGIERVDFLANGAVIGSATAAPWQIAWTAPRAGTWSLQAKATDARDGVALSSARTLTVNAGTTMPTPSAVTATAHGSRRIDLAWSVAAGWNQLQIERSATGASVWVRVATLPEGVSTWTDLTTQPAWTYRYRLRCADDQGNGSWSAEAQATTASSETVIPAAATGLSATAVPGTDAAIDVTWTPGAGASAQAVMARRAGSNEYHAAAWLPGDATSFRHRGLNGTGGWEYTVLAYNGANNHRSSTPVAPLWPTSCTTSTGTPGVLRRLTVVAGVGTGDFAPHTLVQISAGPMPDGYAFVCWRASAGTPTIVDPWNRHTAVYVPDGDATVTAVWRSLGTAPDPVVSLQASTTTVMEGGAATITAALSAAASQSVTVTLGLAGTASASDASLAATSLIIPAGSLNATTTLLTVQDALHEGDETAVVSILSATHTTPGGIQQVTVTIHDDDPPPCASLAATGTILQEDGGVLDVTVSLSAPSGIAVMATLTLGGTATPGQDYQASAQSVVIAPGSLSTSLRFTGLTDAVSEGDETILISISALSGAVATGGDLALVLADVPPPATGLSVQASAAAVTEGGAVTITAGISAPTAWAVNLTLGLSGTASASDASLATTSLIIPAGSLSTTTTLLTVQDALHEADETVVISIISATHAAPGGLRQAIVTIHDDDPPPFLSLNASGTVLQEAGGVLDVTVSLSEPSGAPVRATLVLGGTAIPGQDYQVSTLTAVIAPGSQSTVVRLTGVTDGIDETDETITVSLAGPTGAVVAGGDLALVLADADPTPTLDLTASSGVLTEGGPPAILTASLSAASSRDIHLELMLSGTAQASDLGIGSLSLLIPAGSRSASVSVAALADAEIEGTETLLVSITSAELPSGPSLSLDFADTTPPVAPGGLVTGVGSGSGGCGTGGLASVLVGMLAGAGLRRRRQS